MNFNTLKTDLLTTETIGVFLKIVVIVNVIIAVFFQDLVFLFDDSLQNQSTSYILAVPFILAYIIYRKRKVVKATISIKSEPMLKFLSGSEIIGALLLVISLILYWYGSYTFSPLEYHILALPLFVSACILILFNIQTLRELFFPIVFLFLLVPPPADIFYSFGSILSSNSSSIAYSILNILNYPVVLGNAMGTPAIYLTLQDGTIATFAVDISCSGIYSLVGFFVFALVMAYVVRGKLYKKFAAFLLGFPLIYFLNIVRIFSIVLIGYYAGLSLAVSVFHLLGGWVLIFIGSLLILLISEKVFKVRLFATPKVCSECEPVSLSNENLCVKCNRIFSSKFPKVKKWDIGKILGLIICTILVLSIQVPVFAITEGPAEIILQNPQGEQVETDILPYIPGYNPPLFLYRDFEFENISGQDVSLMYVYYPNDPNRKTMWVGIEIASTRSPLHPWEVCLISYWTEQGIEPRANQLDLEDVELVQNPPIIGRYFHFQWLDESDAYKNPTEAVIYWYETSIFKLDSTSATKNVKISVITYPSETDTNEELKNELFLVSQQIANHWQPIKPWSQTALAISQNGLSLIAILAAGIFIVITLKLYKKYKIKQMNQIAMTKLSKDDKLILDSIKNSQNASTLSNILVSFAKINNNFLTTENLLKRLMKMKEIGLVTEKIINIEDEPFLVWRTDF